MKPTQIIHNGNQTPADYLEVRKLQLLDPHLDAEEKVYLQREVDDLKLMVNEYGNKWVDFGDGDLS